MKYAGLQVADEVAALIRFGERIGWQVTATRNNRLKFVGPHTEGPVFITPKVSESRALENALRDLRKAGFPVETMKNPSAPARQSDEPHDVEDVVEISTNDPVIDEALRTFARTVMYRLSNLRITADEAGSWQKLAEESEKRIGSAEADRDAANRRADAAERRLKQLRAALLGEDEAA